MLPIPIAPRRWLALLAAMLAFTLAASPAQACDATANVSTDVGSFSGPAVKARAVPALRSRAGLSCSPSLIVILGANAITARLHSQNGLKLLRDGGGGSFAYVASADAGGTAPFAQDGSVNYLQSNLVNILGLTGGTAADLPLYIRPNAAALPSDGVYRDRITITWSWYLCPGISALVCITTPDSGSATTTVDLTLTVAAKTLTVTSRSSTTWDPANRTSFPRALPGSRQRTTFTVANPDLVPVDQDSLTVLIPVTSGQAVALDGDGTGSSTVVSFAEGSPRSGLSLGYISASSSTDDVDFSADGGATWTYAPVPGDAVSQGAVTTIRLRPRGSMAAQSSFSVSLPFATR